MAGGKKVYSFQEVSKHSDRKDCWLIIAGKVHPESRGASKHDVSLSLYYFSQSLTDRV